MFKIHSACFQLCDLWTWLRSQHVYDQLDPVLGIGAHGRGRAKLPNQLLTSSETVKYVEEAHERSEKKEKVKKENESFTKQAVADKKRAMKKKNWIVTICFGTFLV